MYRDDLGLVYHNDGDALFTRLDLQRLPAATPMGPRHNPVGFYESVDVVTKALDAVGLEVLKENYVLNKEKTRMFGVMAVQPHALDGEYLPKDAGFVVGLRRSTDQTISAGFVAGTTVFCCSNLAFNGEVRIDTKQTTFINERFPAMAQAAVAKLPQMIQNEARRIEAMKIYKVSQSDQDHLAAALFRRGGLTPQQLAITLQELETPSFEEHEEFKDRLWYFHNCVTQSLKHGRSDAQAKMEQVRERSLVLNALCDTVLH
jgi:hypothetical protein